MSLKTHKIASLQLLCLLVPEGTFYSLMSQWIKNHKQSFIYNCQRYKFLQIWINELAIFDYFFQLIFLFYAHIYLGHRKDSEVCPCLLFWILTVANACRWEGMENIRIHTFRAWNNTPNIQQNSDILLTSSTSVLPQMRAQQFLQIIPTHWKPPFNTNHTPNTTYYHPKISTTYKASKLLQPFYGIIQAYRCHNTLFL